MIVARISSCGCAMIVCPCPLDLPLAQVVHDEKHPDGHPLKQPPHSAANLRRPSIDRPALLTSFMISSALNFFSSAIVLVLSTNDRQLFVTIPMLSVSPITWGRDEIGSPSLSYRQDYPFTFDPSAPEGRKPLFNPVNGVADFALLQSATPPVQNAVLQPSPICI